jgi:hypothetical protein
MHVGYFSGGGAVYFLGVLPVSSLYSDSKAAIASI